MQDAGHGVDMKKILFIGTGLTLLVVVVIVGFAFVSLPAVEPLKNRRFSMTIQVKDWQGNYHPFVVGPKNPSLGRGEEHPRGDEVGGDSGRGRQFLPARGDRRQGDQEGDPV